MIQLFRSSAGYKLFHSRCFVKRSLAYLGMPDTQYSQHEHCDRCNDHSPSSTHCERHSCFTKPCGQLSRRHWHYLHCSARHDDDTVALPEIRRASGRLLTREGCLRWQQRQSPSDTHRIDVRLGETSRKAYVSEEAQRCGIQSKGIAKECEKDQVSNTSSRASEERESTKSHCVGRIPRGQSALVSFLFVVSKRQASPHSQPKSDRGTPTNGPRPCTMPNEGPRNPQAGCYAENRSMLDCVWCSEPVTERQKAVARVRLVHTERLNVSPVQLEL